jgi:hypothetical protein
MIQDYPGGKCWENRFPNTSSPFHSPVVTGIGGIGMMQEMIYAACESARARTGQKVMLPFRKNGKKSVELWLGESE